MKYKKGDIVRAASFNTGEIFAEIIAVGKDEYVLHDFNHHEVFEGCPERRINGLVNLKELVKEHLETEIKLEHYKCLYDRCGSNEVCLKEANERADRLLAENVMLKKILGIIKAAAELKGGDEA